MSNELDITVFTRAHQRNMHILDPLSMSWSVTGVAPDFYRSRGGTICLVKTDMPILKPLSINDQLLLSL